MTAVSDTLLVKFRPKDTRFGVTRRTVKALASELDVSETQVVHLALSLRKDAKDHLPKGKVLGRQNLFG